MFVKQLVPCIKIDTRHELFYRPQQKAGEIFIKGNQHFFTIAANPYNSLYILDIRWIQFHIPQCNIR